MNKTLPGQVEQPSVIYVMEGEVLGIPQIYTGRSQGRTPAISDFNLEWIEDQDWRKGEEHWKLAVE